MQPTGSTRPCAMPPSLVTDRLPTIGCLPCCACCARRTARDAGEQGEGDRGAPPSLPTSLALAHLALLPCCLQPDRRLLIDRPFKDRTRSQLLVFGAWLLLEATALLGMITKASGCRRACGCMSGPTFLLAVPCKVMHMGQGPSMPPCHTYPPTYLHTCTPSLARPPPYASHRACRPRSCKS